MCETSAFVLLPYLCRRSPAGKADVSLLERPTYVREYRRRSSGRSQSNTTCWARTFKRARLVNALDLVVSLADHHDDDLVDLANELGGKTYQQLVDEENEAQVATQPSVPPSALHAPPASAGLFRVITRSATAAIPDASGRPGSATRGVRCTESVHNRRGEDGAAERPRRVLPASGNPIQPDAHRLGGDLRGAAAAVRRPRSTMVAGKLALVPRYRQKVRFVPLNSGARCWVDDPHFNLALPPAAHRAARRPAARSSCATSSGG